MVDANETSINASKKLKIMPDNNPSKPATGKDIVAIRI